MSTSILMDPPHSSPDAPGPSFCIPTASLFFRRLSEPLEQPSLIPARVQKKSTEPTSAPLLLTSTTVPRSPKTLTICGFSPLPSIVASPICTPTSSVSSQTQSEAFLFSASTGVKGDSSSGSNSSSCSSSRVLFPHSPPTWIATPPTPPHKAIRRSNTLSARRSTFKTLAPSTSFPASMQPHAYLNMDKGLKRSTSDPTLSPRLGSPILTNLMGEDIVQSPNSISSPTMENPFDATFSVLNGLVGPEDARRRKDRSGSYSKPIFRLSNGIPASGDEEEVTVCDKGSGCSPEEPSLDGSWSDHSIEDIWETERTKDALRKYHALKELLATEVGYLMDLKALVTVYLRNLPTLAARALSASSTFGLASSFTTGPWINSYTQLQAAALASSSTLPETQNLPPPLSTLAKEPPTKPNSRYIFSDIELESLTRNGEEILQLHEHFVRELCALIEPLGLTMENAGDDYGHRHLANLDAAIRAVSTKFATEASRFNAYQSFCAGHPEAMDIIRKAYQQFPLELDAFELRCATMVSDMLDAGLQHAASEPIPSSSRGSESPTNQTLSVDDRKRAKSSSSLDGAVRTLRRCPSILTTKDSVAFPSEPRREKSIPRLAFTDYMIKPIQRVCKYPLLLDQLLPSKALRPFSQNADARSDVDVVVESAAQAMRHVASSVDEARHRQDIAIQSALVFSRICLASASASHSPPSVQTLTPEFFASLGNCQLAGSLDSMHHHADQPLGQMSSIKAKYFGAFLYSGGYLILVKVSKGRKYEPKHWFSLVDFEVTDEGSWLPCSFRLSSGEQHFELAAACQREKETWLKSIQESLTHVSTWVNEPTPSFKFDGKGELLPESEDGHSTEPPSLPPIGLATIRSIPEIGHTSEPESSEPFFASLRGHGRSKKKRSGYETPLRPRHDMPPPPSRRSSSNSVKAIFSPMTSDPETLLIRRSSPAARLQVEQELQDVISQTILTARLHAFSHEVELFQAPKTTKAGFSRSNSGISMARLSKHESVRVPRRRTTESLDSSVNRRTAPLSSSTASRRGNLKKLSITSIEFDATPVSLEATVSPCPSPSSQSSSSRVTALRASETRSSTLPLPTPEITPLKGRSFVRNVRGIFHLRPLSPISPVSVIVSHPSQTSVPSSAPPAQNTIPYNMLHRWRTKDSLRRRARSVPDEPDNSDAAFDDPEKSYPIVTSRTNTPLST